MDIVSIGMLMGGIIMGLGVGQLIEYFRDKKNIESQETALREIANHKWGTGKHNDAVVITRIALRGLEGE